jgi:CYTH domain-containing protein
MIPVWQKDKYSRLERERKFLLKTLPEDLSLESFRLIEDSYFPDTRLRLRKITDRAGKTLELKLTQKFAAQNQQGDERVITNLYLTESEYALFAALEDHRLQKRRYRYPFEGQHFVIDVFTGHLSGLVLAEIEIEKGTVELPGFATKDVTDDAFFTGGKLAALLPEAFHAALQSYD